MSNKELSAMVLMIILSIILGVGFGVAAHNKGNYNIYKDEWTCTEQAVSKTEYPQEYKCIQYQLNGGLNDGT